MISLDWTLLLQFFNFFFLLFILNRLLYRPLLSIMAQRREQIEGGKAQARDLETEIEEKMQHYQLQLNAAKSEAAQERAELRKAAQQLEAEITSEAQQKAAVRAKNICEQVEKEAAEARQALKDGAGAMASQIAAKVLGRELA